MSWADSNVLWGIIVGGMLVTYATRLSFIAFIPYDRVPAILRSGLRYVAPAVLAALILPELLKPAGSLNLSIANHRLLAGMLASLVAWRTRNAWLTISTGMALLWLLSTLG